MPFALFRYCSIPLTGTWDCEAARQQMRNFTEKTCLLEVNKPWPPLNKHNSGFLRFLFSWLSTIVATPLNFFKIKLSVLMKDFPTLKFLGEVAQH